MEIFYYALYVPKGNKPYPKEIVHHPDLVKYTENWGNNNDPGLLAVNTENDEKVGAAWGRLLIGDDKGYGYVDDETPELSMAVLPALRGRGIGTMLLTDLMRKAKKQYHKISLSVAIGNPAIHLYERFGFKRFAVVDDSITMIKVLYS